MLRDREFEDDIYVEVTKLASTKKADFEIHRPINTIKSAIQVLENFVDEFEVNNGPENLTDEREAIAYLKLVVEKANTRAGK
jgi:hypothetical protein